MSGKYHRWSRTYHLSFFKVLLCRIRNTNWSTQSYQFCSIKCSNNGFVWVQQLIIYNTELIPTTRGFFQSIFDWLSILDYRSGPTLHQKWQQVAKKPVYLYLARTYLQWFFLLRVIVHFRTLRSLFSTSSSPYLNVCYHVKLCYYMVLKSIEL